MAVKHGLGRGLGALIEDQPAAAPAAKPQGEINVPVTLIRGSPVQPRKTFATEAMADLVSSIRAHGVLQPLLLRRAGEAYELVAGERRLRAAREAGLDAVPAIVKEISDRDALELALVENLQREDLNAIEEAEGYQRLAEQFSMSQDEIAQRVGKARATVANALRLLGLPEEIRRMVIEGRLSSGHAKVLLGVPIDEEKCVVARRVVAEDWSVRFLEKAVARLLRGPRKRRAMRLDLTPDHLQYLTDKLQRHLGTAVRLTPSKTMANGKKAKGVMEIEFYSNEDLNRILELLGLTETA